MKNRSAAEPFVMHQRVLLESPAWRALSGDGRKVIDRIELEHLRHGGRDNGRLIVLYDDFRAYGIGHSRVINRGLREAEALGLLEIKRGRAGNGETRAANLYRLTYLSAGNQKPTDEWRQFKTIGEAKARLNDVKRSPSRSTWLATPSKELPREDCRDNQQRTGSAAR
jgi:hypothetical protein